MSSYLARRFGRIVLSLAAALACAHVASADSAQPASIAVDGRGFTVQTLQDGAVAFADQRYTWRGVPLVVSGWQFTQDRMGSAATMTISVLSDGYVYLAVPDSSPDLSGWTRVPAVTFGYDDAGGSGMKVFKMICTAGQSLSVPTFGATSAVVLAPNIESALGKTYRFGNRAAKRTTQKRAVVTHHHTWHHHHEYVVAGHVTTL